MRQISRDEALMALEPTYDAYLIKSDMVEPRRQKLSGMTEDIETMVTIVTAEAIEERR